MAVAIGARLLAEVSNHWAPSIIVHPARSSSFRLRLVSRGAALLAPYADHQTRPSSNCQQEDFAPMLTQALKAEFRGEIMRLVNANRFTLTSIRRLLKLPPSPVKLRPTLVRI